MLVNFWAFLSGVSSLLSMIFALVFPVVYARTADWWKNPIGRGWMISSIAIILLVSKPTIQLVTDTATFSATPYVAIVNTIVAFALFFKLASYLSVVRRERRLLDEESGRYEEGKHKVRRWF